MGSYSPETGGGVLGMAAGARQTTVGSDDTGHRIPDYPNEVYWWDYFHPRAVRFFERPWLVNLILWGKYVMLRDAAVAELGEKLEGRTLQVACVYGDLTPRLAKRVPPGSTTDIVDVLPIQLQNLQKKLQNLQK